MESKPTQQAEATHDNGVVEKDHAAAIDIDSSHLENGIGDLSVQHREYLLARHGTLDLNPLPSMDPADPLNWPAWKNGVQFILYFFFSPETLYVRNSPVPQNDHSSFRRQYLNFGKLGPNPLSWRDFWMPIRLFAYPNILLPTVAYSMVFNFTSVLLTVEIPQIFTPKFHFNAQQIGLQFAGMIIGSVLGPFWFPDMFTSLGLSGSGGLMVGMIVVFSILPTIFIQWKGAPIRTRRADNELDQ
ncbi:hypothetical protein LAWI1_G008258, partial [Lachnellula willkommii]